MSRSVVAIGMLASLVTLLDHAAQQPFCSLVQLAPFVFLVQLLGQKVEVFFGGRLLIAAVPELDSIFSRVVSSLLAPGNGGDQKVRLDLLVDKSPVLESGQGLERGIGHSLVPDKVEYVQLTTHDPLSLL